MTSIKPPVGPSSAGFIPEAAVDSASLVTDPATAAKVGAPDPSAPGVTGAMGAGQAGAAQAVAAAERGTGVDAAQTLAAAVSRGELSYAQALDRVVEGAVQGLSAQLSDLDRADLTAVLQHALAHDPTLAALRDEQG